MTANKAGRSGRGRTERLRKSKGRKESSTRWLKRQLGDPYVAEAQRLGLPWRSLPDPDLGWDVDEPADLESQPSK